MGLRSLLKSLALMRGRGARVAWASASRRSTVSVCRRGRELRTACSSTSPGWNGVGAASGERHDARGTSTNIRRSRRAAPGGSARRRGRRAPTRRSPGRSPRPPGRAGWARAASRRVPRRGRAGRPPGTRRRSLPQLTSASGVVGSPSTWNKSRRCFSGCSLRKRFSFIARASRRWPSGRPCSLCSIPAPEVVAAAHAGVADRAHAGLGEPEARVVARAPRPSVDGAARR